MNFEEIRRINLKNYIKEKYNNVWQLHLVTKTSYSRVYALLRGHRKFSDMMARSLEASIGMKAGSLDKAVSDISNTNIELPVAKYNVVDIVQISEYNTTLVTNGELGEADIVNTIYNARVYTANNKPRDFYNCR